MCFVLKKGNLLKEAKRDIHVKKKIMLDDEGTYCTFYQKFPIPDDGILEADNLNAYPWLSEIKPTVTLYITEDEYTVYENAIHSYSRNNAVGRFCDVGRIVVHAIIPKGSLYYYNKIFREFISTKLIVPIAVSEHTP